MTKGVERDVMAIRGSRGTPGVSRGFKGAYRCPRGSRGVLGVSEGLREV